MARRKKLTAAARRAQLIEVGRSVFAQKGYEATSVEEIADCAKVSKPIVYEHFGGKEGLYAVVVDREARDLPRAMYTTIIIVIVLYVAMALAVVAAASPEKLTGSGSMLLAEAARGAFGEIGFKVLLVSAVVSTITCINGGLFGVTSILAQETNDQGPENLWR